MSMSDQRPGIPRATLRRRLLIPQNMRGISRFVSVARRSMSPRISTGNSCKKQRLESVGVCVGSGARASRANLDQSCTYLARRSSLFCRFKRRVSALISAVALAQQLVYWVTFWLKPLIYELSESKSLFSNFVEVGYERFKDIDGPNKTSANTIICADDLNSPFIHMMRAICIIVIG